MADTDKAGVQTLVEEFEHAEIGPMALSPDEKTFLTSSPPTEREASVWQWKVR